MPNPLRRRSKPASAAPELSAQIASLLLNARAAHAAYRVEAKTRNYPALEAHVRRALDLRREAETLDSGHTAVAWTEDRLLNKGQSSDTLIAFYEKYLVIE